MKQPRKVRCARCGDEASLRVDEPGRVVQLPHGWKRVGNARDGSPVFFCPACYDAVKAAANDDEAGK